MADIDLSQYDKFHLETIHYPPKTRANVQTVTPGNILLYVLLVILTNLINHLMNYGATMLSSKPSKLERVEVLERVTEILEEEMMRQGWLDKEEMLQQETDEGEKRTWVENGAIRYEVHVPPFEERPPTPYKTPGTDIGDLRIPCVLLCHCNNCRLGANQILPIGLVCETKTVQVSVLPRSTTTTSEGAFDIPDRERTSASASEIFDPRNPNPANSHLSVYRSSPQRSRWFCSRCGTSIGYSIDPGVIPEAWGWPTMLDLWSATIDREDLEKEYMAPERMVWCHYAVPWVGKLAREGAGGIPEHPLTKIDKVVGDDVTEDLRELEALEQSTKGK
ncbi:uncharacterized protein LTR77_008654 [Saxophila tyrrhenica]|uniref:CENP-V/GFA domain-containing protein n=1 Tax=Saxophila tyrrhenica TaxID=1690608 RepID=A0AAV9P3K1_9PEZI|nr:hypothetical protein LTR77_008654 [Saxophila tyrrhenica]